MICLPLCHKNYTDIKQAREQAEQASESKSRFLASMSHDSNPYERCSWHFLSLLKETKLTKDQSHLVNTASTSGELLYLSLMTYWTSLVWKPIRSFLNKNLFSQECITAPLIALSLVPTQKISSLFTPYQPDDLPVMVVGGVHRFQQILLNLIGEIHDQVYFRR